MNDSDIIIYKSYPGSIGFYSPNHHKIFINPIVKKYSVYHDYLINNEKGHYNNATQGILLCFIKNLNLDYKDWIKVAINPKIRKEAIECEREFNSIEFTENEIVDYENAFSLERFSKEWFISLLYVLFRPDGYLFGPLIVYVVFDFYHTRIISLFSSLICFFSIYYLRNLHKIKLIKQSIVKKIGVIWVYRIRAILIPLLGTITGAYSTLLIFWMVQTGILHNKGIIGLLSFPIYEEITKLLLSLFVISILQMGFKESIM
jgi:hypothetical protein